MDTVHIEYCDKCGQPFRMEYAPADDDQIFLCPTCRPNICATCQKEIAPTECYVGYQGSYYHQACFSRGTPP